MEYDINHIFIITVPLITILLYLISKSLLIITIIVSSIVVLFTLYIYNSLNRKESLNIIKNRDILYFYLSDDELFSIKLSKDDLLSEVLSNIILIEMPTIELMVDRIDFVNFKDDKLNKELNLLIVKSTN
ncbi:MAG TPA: hypothetical protein ENK99_05705 [Campylobacterales bacterium]|nr:hypothetical protein [Campylobacterales bacterium]HHH51218.1 hypothetical protein [Campylobacterales bacterium]